MSSACKEVRLDAPGKSMSRIPVMDQDSKWICYAYTASQMVDAWRFSHGDRNYSHITSPAATAVFYASQRTDWNAKDIDYGWQADAIASITKNGSCDYKTIFNKFGQTGLKEYFGELKKHFDEFQVMAYQQSIRANQRQNNSLRDIASAIRDKTSNTYSTVQTARAVQCTLRSAGSGVPVASILEISDALSQPTYLKYLEKLFTPICTANKKSIQPVPNAKKIWAKDYPPEKRIQEIEKQMNDQFNKPNPQPMGINYCENVLWDKNTQGIDSYGEFNWNTCRSHHISAVIGQRPTAGGGCEFLVRNSYGQSCNAYPDWKCENGQIWVDSKTLVKNMNGVSWLED